MYWENIFDRLGSQTLLTVLLFQQFQEGWSATPAPHALTFLNISARAILVS